MSSDQFRTKVDRDRVRMIRFEISVKKCEHADDGHAHVEVKCKECGELCWQSEPVDPDTTITVDEKKQLSYMAGRYHREDCKGEPYEPDEDTTDGIISEMEEMKKRFLRHQLN